MSHQTLLKTLLTSIKASNISAAAREEILRPLADQAMAEVVATPSRGGWENLLTGYAELGVIDVMDRFYTTENSLEARVIWRACGGVEDRQVEDFIALWTDRDETIPSWKQDILH